MNGFEISEINGQDSKPRLSAALFDAPGSSEVSCNFSLTLLG